MTEVGTVAKVCSVCACQRDVVFDWKVENFASLSDRSYFSPYFDFSGRSWYVQLYPDGEAAYDSEGYIGVYLCLADRGPPVEVRFSLGVRTARGDTEVWTADTSTFEGKYRRYWSGLERCIEREVLFRRGHELLPLDALTLTVKLKVGNEVASEEGAKDVSVQTGAEDDVLDAGKSEPGEKRGSQRVLQDIGKLWPSGDHCDVVLKVRDAEFKAHRAILAVRTPVLCAMFQHNTAEAASGEVTIEDCEPAVFEQLLHYIYAGAPRELTAENASALYVVADKYLVGEVKELCVRCMKTTLCLDTFCDTVRLSLMHREDELLEMAVDFFSKNMLRILESVEWQMFLREHSTWANEILISAQRVIAKNEKDRRAEVDSPLAYPKIKAGDHYSHF